MITDASERRGSLSRSSSTASNGKSRLSRKRSLCLPNPNQSLHVPIPPSLLQSPYLNSPQSIFQRTVSAPRLPSEEDEEWLQDTVPISGQIRAGSYDRDGNGYLNFQNPSHQRYYQQRRSASGSVHSSLSTSPFSSPASPASRLPASSGTGLPVMTITSPPSPSSAGSSFASPSHMHTAGRGILSVSNSYESASVGGASGGIGISGGLDVDESARHYSAIPPSPPLVRWHKACAGPMSPSPWLGHSPSRSDSSVMSSAESSYFAA
ncbi:hypothetical protein AX16_010502 [Volvariella volvacea WC 439]|nr:hypothetical protein AX16_010502 [Volvariella volvacea WC 439]